MAKLERRTFLGLISLALLGGCAGAQSGPANRDVRSLLRHTADACRRVRLGELSPLAWQERMAELFADAPVHELIALVDVDPLLATQADVERGARIVTIPSGELFPGERGPTMKLFSFHAHRANPPHDHENMVSMHLVLRGSFRVRHFERIQATPTHILVRPTIDRVLTAGELTTISDARDNAHWHVAQSEGVLLDVLVSDLGSQPTETHFLDIERAEALDDGTLQAPRIESVEEALERYG